MQFNFNEYRTLLMIYLIINFFFGIINFEFCNNNDTRRTEYSTYEYNKFINNFHTIRITIILSKPFIWWVYKNTLRYDWVQKSIDKLRYIYRYSTNTRTRDVFNMFIKSLIFSVFFHLKKKYITLVKSDEKHIW